LGVNKLEIVVSKHLRRLVQRYSHLAIMFSLALSSGSLHAGAGLLVAPTRVVFEGSQRSATLTLVNTGEKAATYRISFIEMQMTESGQIFEIEATEAGETYASQLVRYSPRQVTLEPHTPQVVRLKLRKPGDLIAGEYRSHLLFRTIPSVESSLTPEKPSESESSSREIELRPLFGVAVPMIVRHGSTSADAQLTNLSLLNGLSSTDISKLSVKISRSGNRSVYGNIDVIYTGSDGVEHLIGEVDGVAVYTPTPVRQIDIRLNQLPGQTLNEGRLRVVYTAVESAQTNSRHASPILAEAELILPAQTDTETLAAEE